MNPPGFIQRTTETAAVVLTGAAMGLTQILIGGTRLVFSLPGCALLAFVALLTIFFWRTPKAWPDQICLLSSGLFFGYVLIRALFSPVAYTARPDFYSVLGGLVVYLFVACFCTSAKTRSWLLFFLISLALVHITIGAIQFRDGNNFMLISSLGRFDYGRRASGFYVCPNHLAGLLEVLAIFGVSLVCWSRFPAWSKLLIGYGAAVCFLGIGLTASRGGYVSTMVGLLVFAVLSLIVLRRSKRRQLFWYAGGFGALAAVILAGSIFFLMHESDVLTQRVENFFDSAPIRIDLWKAAIQQWKVQPLVGTGSGTYLYYGRLFRTEKMQMDPIDAHNDYLHLLAEYGAVGELLFLLFLCIHLRSGWNSFQQLGPKRVAIGRGLLSGRLALNIGALASVAAYIVHSFVDFNLHIPANVLLLAFVFGIVANDGIDQKGIHTDARMAMFWRAALPILGLILAVQCHRLLPSDYFAEQARVAQRNGHPERAITLASRGLATDKRNPNLYDYLASAQFTLCDKISNRTDRIRCFAEPVKALETARALAPEDRAILLKLALGYDVVGRYPEAEWIFYEARKWDPRSIYLDQIYRVHLRQWAAEPAQLQANQME